MNATPENLALWVELIRRGIGTFGEHSIGDPMRPYPPTDDLVKGWGTPPGFELMRFAITERADDPRLTTEGLNRIATVLRAAAGKWMYTKCRAESLWGCKTPDIRIDTFEDRMMFSVSQKQTFVRFVCSVYVYPPLTVKIAEFEEKK